MVPDAIAYIVLGGAFASCIFIIVKLYRKGG